MGCSIETSIKVCFVLWLSGYRVKLEITLLFWTKRFLCGLRLFSWRFCVVAAVLSYWYACRIDIADWFRRLVAKEDSVDYCSLFTSFSWDHCCKRLTLYPFWGLEHCFVKFWCILVRSWLYRTPKFEKELCPCWCIGKRVNPWSYRFGVVSW